MPKGYTVGKWADQPYAACTRCPYDRVGDKAEQDVKEHVAKRHGPASSSQQPAVTVTADSRDDGGN